MKSGINILLYLFCFKIEYKDKSKELLAELDIIEASFVVLNKDLSNIL